MDKQCWWDRHLRLSASNVPIALAAAAWCQWPYGRWNLLAENLPKVYVIGATQ
jgi:hypothetical protein